MMRSKWKSNFEEKEQIWIDWLIDAMLEKDVCIKNSVVMRKKGFLISEFLHLYLWTLHTGAGVLKVARHAPSGLGVQQAGRPAQYRADTLRGFER